MKVTKVELKKSSKNPYIKAYARVYLDKAICIQGLMVVENEGSRYVAYPTESSGMFDNNQAFSPVGRELRDAIENAILDAFEG